MPTLLLADASPMMHRIVELTFAHEDIRVVGVRDGEQAMALIAEDRPDIVLADHAVPKRTGYEVAAFVKRRPDLAHIPVVLLSGAFEPIDKVRAAQVGCDGVLVKPFEPREAVARVRELLERSAARSPATSVAAETGHAEEDVVDSPEEGAAQVPTVDALLGLASTSVPPVTADTSPSGDRPVDAAPDAGPSGGMAPRPTGGLTDLSELADALGAMLRREPLPLPPPNARPLPSEPVLPPPISDDLVDEVTRRVLEKLAPGAVDRVVYGVVSRIAERLLREEIQRRSGGT